MNDRGKHRSNQNSTEWVKLASGEVASFELVYKKFYPQLYGYGVKLSNRPDLVKDSIQELFEKIWQSRAKLSHIESPNVYLVVSLRRRILEKLQKEKYMEEQLEHVFDSPQIDFGIEDIMVKNESGKSQKEALLRALNQLPNRQKEVVYLRYFNGMSYGEIEEILSINRQSVRNHIYRAMEVLRTILDRETMLMLIVPLIGVIF